MAFGLAFGGLVFLLEILDIVLYHKKRYDALLRPEQNSILEDREGRKV